MTPVRADHLTLARLVLLPIPLALLYQSDPAWRIAALGMFVLLGLTDVWDGPLARRQGPTRIGEALDILADRVFLALVFCIFADLGIVPVGVLVALLARELLVASLRTLPTVAARTGPAGKLRTTVQMYGAGLLLLLSIAERSPVVDALLLSGVIAGTSIQIRSWRRDRRRDWRALWAIGLAGSLELVRMVRPAATAPFLIAVIVGVSVGTAIGYAWSARRQIGAGLAASPWERWRVVVTTVAIPVFWAPRVETGPPLSIVVGVLAALELGRLLLRSNLARSVARIEPRREIVRGGLLAAAGSVAAALG